MRGGRLRGRERKNIGYDPLVNLSVCISQTYTCVWNKAQVGYNSLAGTSVSLSRLLVHCLGLLIEVFSICWARCMDIYTHHAAKDTKTWEMTRTLEERSGCEYAGENSLQRNTVCLTKAGLPPPPRTLPRSPKRMPADTSKANLVHTHLPTHRNSEGTMRAIRDPPGMNMLTSRMIVFGTLGF